MDKLKLNEQAITSVRLIAALRGPPNGDARVSGEVSFDLSAFFAGRDLASVLRVVELAGILLGKVPLAELEKLAAEAGAKKPESKPTKARLISAAAELRPLEEEGLPPLRLKAETIIGRSRLCDLALRSPKVSRQHVKVLAAEGGHVIEDLGSANHTWVNGNRIERAKLQDGDVVMIGDVPFEYRVLKS